MKTACMHSVDSPLGAIHLACDDEALIGLTFRGAEELRREVHYLGYTLHSGASALARRAADEITGYFAGTRTRFTIPTRMHGTDFQQAVWKTLQAVPYGKTVSYGELAALAGSPRASRAVGTTMARNRLPLVVPCHRVLRCNGLGGFSGGEHIKRYLLEMEGVACG